MPNLKGNITLLYIWPRMHELQPFRTIRNNCLKLSVNAIPAAVIIVFQMSVHYVRS